MTAIHLPAHLRPMAVIVHVRSDDGTILGAFAAVDARGVRQSPLRVVGSAISHAQAVLSVLVRALRPVTRPLPGLRIYLPDRTVVAMLDGSMDPHSPAMGGLVADAGRLIAERTPAAVIAFGRFDDLVGGLLVLGDDVWA